MAPAQRRRGSRRPRWPRARVVMLSGAAGAEATLETVRAGADGYLTKDGAIAEVVSAVRSVDAGRVMLPSTVFGEIARRLGEEPDEPPLAQGLTGRELKVPWLPAGRTARSRTPPNCLPTPCERTFRPFAPSSGRARAPAWPHRTAQAYIPSVTRPSPRYIQVAEDDVDLPQQAGARRAPIHALSPPGAPWRVQELNRWRP
jgi:CheY-like chemotaxis protein